MKVLPSLLVNHDRVLYRGLLGQPTVRILGAFTIYAVDEGSLKLSVEGAPDVQMAAAVVQPFVPHLVSAETPHVHCLMIEPDFVSLPDLPAFLNPDRQEFAHVDWPTRLAQVSMGVAAEPAGRGISVGDFDQLVFGMPLPARNLDARIEAVLHAIREAPAGAHSAEACAEQCHLSTSRFMHLFKSEVGVSFRTYKTWRRARSLLKAVGSGVNLTTVAHDLGYSDSAYFSNSIRHFTGLRPKDIMAGSRGMRLIDDE